MAQAGLTVEFQTALNPEGFQKGLNKIQERILDIPAQNIAASLPNVDTGNLQRSIDLLMAQGNLLDTITVKTKTFTTESGQSYTAVVGASARYLDALNNIGTAQIKVTNQLDIYDKKKSKYDALTKKAIDWGTRAENMNAKEGGAIKESSRLLLEKIAQYQRLGNEGNIAEANKLIPAIEDEAVALEKSIAASKRAGEGARSFGQRLSDAMKNLVAYAGAAQVLRKAINELNKAIKFTIDLNTEMTKIQVLQAEGAQTSEEIRNLASAYNDLAKELGATTIEIAQGSVEWLRQGKTIQETTKLLVASTQMAKLGNLSTAESTEYLTSVLNGFKLEAQDAASVVDKLIAVDNVAATSTAELATALRYSSAVANQVGVSLEQLISYTAVVSETTRQNAESIGQGFKTMLTRMQDIKAGAIDEEGLGINNVEIALRRVDIQLRESEDEFRDFGDVLEELAGKWDTLTEVEQANISKAIAGVRQANMFNVLMQNMSRALELQEAQYDATGLAAQRYQIYLNSVQAKQDQLKASVEKLYQSFLSSDFLKRMLDLAKSAVDITDKLGGIRTVVTLATSAFLAFNTKALIPLIASLFHSGEEVSYFKTVLTQSIPALFGNKAALEALTRAQNTYAASTGTAIKTTEALKASLVSTGIGAGIVILGIAASAIMKLSQNAKEAAASLGDLMSKVSDTEANVATAISLRNEYVELNKTIQSSTASTEEKAKAEERLYEVERQLKEIFPQLSGYYDEQGRFIATSVDNINALIESLQELQKIQEETAKSAAMSTLFKTEYNTGIYDATGQGGIRQIANTESIEDAWEKLEEKRAAAQKDYNATTAKEMQDALDEFNLIQTHIMQAMSIAGQEFSQEFIDSLENPDLKASFQRFLDSLEKVQLDRAAKAYAENYKAIQENYEKQQLIAQGYTEKQIEGYKRAGAGADLTSYLLEVEIPKAIRGLEAVKEAFAAVNSQELITQEQIDKLNAFGIQVETAEDGTRTFIATTEDGSTKILTSAEDYIDLQAILIAEAYHLTDAQKELYRQYLEQAQIQDELKNLESATKAVADAQKEYAEQGYISAESAYELVAANGELADALIASGDGFIFNKEAAISTLQADVLLKLEQLGLAQIASLVEQGMYSQAASMLVASNASATLAANLSPLVSTLALLAQLSGQVAGKVSGGGGGGGAARKEDPRIKETEELIEDLEDEIDLYEKQKDAIKEAQDQYHDWIDAKKESLKLTKEENDYLKEQQKKANNLSDIRTQIETLALDNSEEARAKRLELESQAAELEEEITADSEDRKYDMQIQALEDLQDAYDKMIENQIKGIDEVIDKIKEQIDAYRELIEQLREAQQGGGGGGGGISSVFSNVVKELQIFAKNLAEAGKSPKLFKLAVEDIARILDEEIAVALESGNEDLAAKLQTLRDQIDEATADNVLTQEEIKSLTTTLTTEFGSLPEEIRQKIADSLKTTLTIDLKVYFRAPTTGTASLPYPSIPSSRMPTNKMPPPGTGSIYAPHTGGLIEEHHAGNFAGNLNSNEVFAKLLKGEYVATEGQMDKFLKQTMPAITNAAVNKSAQGASISVNMPITVEGNLDKEVIPDIDKIADKVVNTITKTLTKKGYIRPANLTVS